MEKESTSHRYIYLDHRQFLELSDQHALFQVKLADSSLNSQYKYGDFAFIPAVFLGLMAVFLLLDEIRAPEATPFKMYLDLVGGGFMFLLALGLWHIAKQAQAHNQSIQQQVEDYKQSVYLVRLDKQTQICALIGPFNEAKATPKALKNARQPVVATTPFDTFKLKLQKNYGRALPWSDAYDDGEFDFIYYSLLLIPQTGVHPAFGRCIYRYMNFFEGIQNSTDTETEQTPPLAPLEVERLQQAESLMGQKATTD